MDWYKRDPAAFIVGTASMETEAVGAYQLLLDHQWDLRRLPKEPGKLARLARLAPRRFRKHWQESIGAKFKQDADGYYNQRLEDERLRAGEIAEKKRLAGRLGGLANAQADATADAQANGKQKGKQTRGTRDLVISLSSYLDSEKDAAGRVLALLNEKTGRRYPLLAPGGDITANVREIIARLRDGWSEEQLRAVVIRRWRRWGSDPKMSDYLQPSTLFRKSNFERYVAEVGE